jgi:hypothetical protein
MYHSERIIIEPIDDSKYNIRIGNRSVVLLNSWLDIRSATELGTHNLDVSRTLRDFLRGLLHNASRSGERMRECNHRIRVDTKTHPLPTEKIGLTELCRCALHNDWIFCGEWVDTSSDIIFYLSCLEKHFPIEVRYTVFSLLLLM